MEKSSKTDDNGDDNDHDMPQTLRILKEDLKNVTRTIRSGLSC